MRPPVQRDHDLLEPATAPSAQRSSRPRRRQAPTPHARLKELEQAGVVVRRVLARPESGVAYELTEYGRELEDVLLRLGLWGAKSIGEPRPQDTVSLDAFLLGLRTIFRPAAARGVRATYELRLGDLVVHARVDDGDLEVAEGSLTDPDLVLESDLTLRTVLAGELDPDEAIASGSLKLTGDRELLDRFLEIFRISTSAGLDAGVISVTVCGRAQRVGYSRSG